MSNAIVAGWLLAAKATNKHNREYKMLTVTMFITVHMLLPVIPDKQTQFNESIMFSGVVAILYHD